jgi:hypothetical protein
MEYYDRRVGQEMKDTWMKKGLVCAVILLFIGTGIVSAINVNQNNKSNTRMDNHPPDQPVFIGPIPKNVGVEYKLTIVTNDPDGDDIANYTIDWGDDNVDILEGPFPSSVGVVTSHTWYKEGWYILRCKANDTYGAESEWAEYLLRIWRTKISSNSLLLHFSESTQQIIQLFQNLLLHYQTRYM